MKVYIAGTYTNGDTLAPFIIERTRAKFFIAESSLIKLGHEPVNPLKLPIPNGSHWKAAMVICLHALLDCEGIHLLEGWQDSKGASFERLVAMRLQMPVVDV